MKDELHPPPTRLTTELVFFDNDQGSCTVYLPVTGYAFHTSRSDIAILAKLQRGEHLYEGEFSSSIVQTLHRLNVIGDTPRPRPETKPITEFLPVEATLIFTETCNLGCSYCYASSVPARSKPMSKELAAAAVDTVINNASRTKQRTAEFRYIGGGEPTIQWDLIQWVTEYIKRKAREANVNHWIRIITNGTLLSEEKVDWISRNIQFVTLSFDVLPELQANRPFANGRSTQSKLLSVMRLLDKYGVQFHIRSTVPASGSHRLEEMVEYIIVNTPAKSVRFEPMAEVGRSISTEIGKPSQQAFVESFKRAHSLGKSNGLDVTCKMFSMIKRRSSRFCNAEFSVSPNGYVSACHRYSRDDHDGIDLFKIGQFNGDHFEFDIDQINKVRSIDNSSFQDCKTCLARWNCASGCLSARMNRGVISEHGPLCYLTRELVKYSVEEAINGVRK